MMSESEKQQAKEVLKQLVELAKEFKPELKELAGEYMDLFLDSKKFNQITQQNAALKIYCQLLEVHGPGSDSLSLIHRATEDARMLLRASGR